MAQVTWLTRWQMAKRDEAQLASNAPRVLPTSPPKQNRAWGGQHLCIVIRCLQPHCAASQQKNHLMVPCRGLGTAQPHWDAKGQSQSPASKAVIPAHAHTHTHTKPFICYEVKIFQSLRSCLLLALTEVLGDVIPVVEIFQKCGGTAIIRSFLICAFLWIVHDFQSCETESHMMNREHFTKSHRTNIEQQ